MATRPLFIPLSQEIGVAENMLEFKWFPGMALSQKRKSIASLHEAAQLKGYKKVLEVSSKSEETIGVELSAFNLVIKTKIQKREFTVESAFQGSKVFERGGPYKDLIGLDSLKAKKDIRLKESGNLIGFEFYGMEFPIIPRTYFYDWLYINALVSYPSLTERIRSYDAFSDIEFNPIKSINCQAHSIALYFSLVLTDSLQFALSSPSAFLECTQTHYTRQRRNVSVQQIMV